MSRVRVVSYAINGRGMGHLTRQLAILRQARRLAEVAGVGFEAWVLTSSEADTLARREGFAALKMPSKAMLRDAGVAPARMLAVMRAWVLNAIAGLQPDLLLVDTFPAGSFGELIAPLELVPNRVLVARRVRDSFSEESSYQALLPLYQRMIEPDARGVGPIVIRDRAELLSRDQARAQLGVPAGQRAVYVSLGGGGDAAAPDTLPRLVDRLVGRGWHVVVGAGPLYQGPERRGPGVTWLSRYTPIELLPGVDAAVSAAGYNSFHELMYAGVPTVFLPQPRIADDQEARARRAEDAGAGRVASGIDQVPELLEAPGEPEAARALVPVNGAREAAIQALSAVIPEDELRAVSRVVTPELTRLLGRIAPGGGSPWKAGLELLRLLAGGAPADHARRRVALAELAELGHPVPSLPTPPDPSARVERFVATCASHQIPYDLAMSLLRSLSQKFPAARGESLLQGFEDLARAWGPFADWMGAVSLVRAIPTQRTYSLAAWSADMERWLAGQDDLFDALRELARLEGRGRRPLAEVMRLLIDRGGDS